MGNIIVTEFLTLDGVVEDPGGSEGTERGGWSFRFPDEDGLAFKLEELRAAEAMLLGRVTYEGFAEAWPERTDEIGFADAMNAMPKHVVSTTLTDPSWNNTTVIRDDLPGAVAALKGAHEGDLLVYGSRTLVAALQALGLVDEYRLMVHPVLLGAGATLWRDAPAEQALRLVECRPLESGTVILRYTPA